MIKALFGGTFGYIQAGLVGILALGALWLWRDYQGAKADVDRLTTENTALEGQIASKDGVIASMSRSAGRRDTQSQQSQDLGDDILKAKDGTWCASSEPMRIVLDGLRNNAGAKTADNPDAAIPVLAGAYPAPTE